jgi:hypothetical protein
VGHDLLVWIQIEKVDTDACFAGVCFTAAEKLLCRIICADFIYIGGGNNGSIKAQDAYVPKFVYGDQSIRQYGIHAGPVPLGPILVEISQAYTKLGAAGHQAPAFNILHDNPVDPIALDGGHRFQVIKNLSGEFFLFVGVQQTVCNQ